MARWTEATVGFFPRFLVGRGARSSLDWPTQKACTPGTGPRGFWNDLWLWSAEEWSGCSLFPAYLCPLPAPALGM